jgi:hypothetical protein
VNKLRRVNKKLPNPAAVIDAGVESHSIFSQWTITMDLPPLDGLVGRVI